MPQPDLSSLADSDLQAIASGDMSKVSIAGLQHLAGPETPATSVQPSSLLEKLKGAADSVARYGTLAAKGLVNGVVDTGLIIPRGLQAGYNLATGQNTPLIGDAYHQTMDKITPPPQNIPEALTQAAGGMAGGVAAGGGIPTPAAAANTPMQATNAMAREAGYVLPPAEIANAGNGMRLAGALAGTRQTLAAAAPRNNAQTVANMADEFGLPKGTQMTPGTVEAIVNHADATGYQPIRALGTQWADLLKQIQSYRDTARKLFEQDAATPHVETLAQAKAMNSAAQNAESVLEQALRANGQAGLYDGYTAARTTIAKANDVDRALQQSTGVVQGAPMARAFGEGAPQSGAIQALGRTAQMVPQAFAKPAAEGQAVPAHTAYELISDLLHAGAYPIRQRLLSNGAQDYMQVNTPEMRKAALVKALAAGLGGLEGSQ